MAETPSPPKDSRLYPTDLSLIEWQFIQRFRLLTKQPGRFSVVIKLENSQVLEWEVSETLAAPEKPHPAPHPPRPSADHKNTRDVSVLESKNNRRQPHPVSHRARLNRRK